jgi:uncharacterized protein (TIGR02145 family)
MDKPIDIFISYSSKDVAIADAVCHYLEKQEMSCWIAPRNIRAGCDYGAEINSALKECKIVILIFSKHSNASRDVTNEVNLAFNKGKIIIPFKIEEVELSDSLEYYLGRVHWTNAISNPESHFEKLLEQCSIHILMDEKTNKQLKSGNDLNPNMNDPDQSHTDKLTTNTNDIIWLNRVMGTFTDYRDKHQYKVVKIGTKIWLAENLAFIPHVSPVQVQGGIWVNGYDGTNVIQARETNNYTEYGCLYDWETAMDPVNQICPEGWHIPSDDEWTLLTNQPGGENIEGGELKERGISHWFSPNQGATNKSGFTALPGGNRYSDGAYNRAGYIGCWWSSTEYSAAHAWYAYLLYNSTLDYRNHKKKQNGYSVRCLRDL